MTDFVEYLLNGIVGSEATIAIFTILNCDAVKICWRCGRSFGNLPDGYPLRVPRVSLYPASDLAFLRHMGVMIVTPEKVRRFKIHRTGIFNRLACEGDNDTKQS